MDTSRAGESFRDLLLRHRGRTGLTQLELAGRVGAGRRTVQDWEAGINHPSAELLKALIQALLEADGLTAGREAAEAHELWAAVLRDAQRMHTPFDELWLASLLREPAAPPPAPEAAHDAGTVAPIASSAETGEERRQDWGDAPDVLGFVGRVDEQALVRNWVLGQHCRVVGVLGIGGIGKTSIAAKLAKDVAPAFQRVYWRSLRNAPPVSEWLADAIGFLSDQRRIAPNGEAARLAALLELLRDRASLLVLDNFETLLEPRQREGGYRDGFAGYGAVLRAVGEAVHQSCLVLTSREAPPELAVLSGHAVRTLDLGGLGVPEGQVLLADKQLSGNAADWANLIGRFGGNGLALKLVGESIRQVFGGDIGAFLHESGSGTVFGGIRRLLAEQIERGSALEQNALRVLAVAREPVTIAELIAELGPRAGRGAVVEAVEALRRRSLVERSQTTTAAAFTLQSVVLEYVTDRLVEEVCDEIARGQPLRLVEQPLIKAQAKDYVRQTQERLIGAPVLRQVKAEHGDAGAEQMLLALLDGWRDRAVEDQGYGPGNVVNLLRLQRGDLRGRDFAGLAIRQAYLAEVEAQGATLARAHLSEVVLAEAFNFPICVALSGDGASLVTGTSAGEVWLWRVADRTPLMAIRMRSGPVYAVALSADGRLLAGGSEDGVVRLWETPDGRLLASGSFDGTVRLWEASSGAHLHTLRSDRRYERVDVTGLTGVTAAQRVSLLALGAIEPGQATEVSDAG